MTGMSWAVLLCSTVRMCLSSNRVYVCRIALLSVEWQKFLFAVSRGNYRDSWLVGGVSIVSVAFSSIHGTFPSSLPSCRELCRRGEKNVRAGGRWRMCGALTPRCDVTSHSCVHSSREYLYRISTSGQSTYCCGWGMTSHPSLRTYKQWGWTLSSVV